MASLSGIAGMSEAGRPARVRQRLSWPLTCSGTANPLRTRSEWPNFMTAARWMPAGRSGPLDAPSFDVARKEFSFRAKSMTTGARWKQPSARGACSSGDDLRQCPASPFSPVSGATKQDRRSARPSGAALRGFALPVIRTSCAVSAAELKAEEMVKMPIRLTTDRDWRMMIAVACDCRIAIEDAANADAAKSGVLFRRLVLFQTQCASTTYPHGLTCHVSENRTRHGRSCG